MKTWLPLVFALIFISSCTLNDQSRKFYLDAGADEDGWVEIRVDSTLEKTGGESSASTIDAKADVSATGL